jgi:CheY-like chemotaxis protein
MERSDQTLGTLGGFFIADEGALAHSRRSKKFSVPNGPFFEPPACSSRAMNSLAILMADDFEEIQNLLRLWLAEIGYQVTCVGYGASGAWVVKCQQFDVLITDVLMPNGRGLELMRAFTRALPADQILAISGGGQHLPARICMKIAWHFGAHALLGKDVHLSAPYRVRIRRCPEKLQGLAPGAALGRAFLVISPFTPLPITVPKLSNAKWPPD